MHRLDPQKNSDSITLWAGCLADHAENVRTQARLRLEQAAAAGEASAVNEQVGLVLKGQSWRALQQAALLASSIHATESATLLVPLLKHQRPEVRHASAGALRSLQQPETVEAIFGYLQERFDAGKPLSESDQAAVTQLLLAMGEMHHAPADKMLQQRLPKSDIFGMGPRRAATWSLGMLHEGQPNPQVIKLLAARANDRNMMEIEDEGLQIIALESIARIDPKAAVAIIRRNYNDQQGPEALRIAARSILVDQFGQDLPAMESIPSRTGPWFLEPTR